MFNADIFDPVLLINLCISVRAATDGPNFCRKVSMWRFCIFFSGSRHNLSLCRNGFLKKYNIFTQVGLFQPCETATAAEWLSTGVVLLFSCRRNKKKRKYSDNLTSGHVLFSEQLSTVFHFCFSVFFLRLFSPFHFFLAPLIRERGGIVAAHLLSTALRLVDW